MLYNLLLSSVIILLFPRFLELLLLKEESKLKTPVAFSRPGEGFFLSLLLNFFLRGLVPILL